MASTTKKTQFKVGGMSCSFCTRSIEDALAQMDGVESVSVSLSHEEALVEYDEKQIEREDLKKTLTDLGYSIRDPDKIKAFEEQQEELRSEKRRLITAGILSGLALGLMIWMWFQLGVYTAGHFTDVTTPGASPWMGWATFGIAIITMFGPGWYIKKKAYQSLRRGILNQHVLMEFAAFGGLIGGLLGLGALYSPFLKSWLGPHFPVVHFFGVSVFVTSYHILSSWSALLVRTKASESVRKLMNLQPDTAIRLDEDGNQEDVPVNQLEEGDHVKVRPGDRIPIDGIVRDGTSGVDESIVTGESMPEEKRPGDEVVGGSINQTGSLSIEVAKTGEETFLNQVARHVEEARAMKPGILKVTDRVMQYFVPGVLSVAVATFVFWTLGASLIWGSALVGQAVFATLAVLVLGYPCALGMATPLAMIRGGGMAAQRGILMRSGEAFQVLPSITHVVFDKTGTLTVGEPSVQSVEPVEAYREEEVLRKASVAEEHSEHPLSEAILDEARDRSLEWSPGTNFSSTSGKGVSVEANGSTIRVGKINWLEENGIDCTKLKDSIERLERRGQTVVAVAEDHELTGIIALADSLKEDASEAVRRLKDRGITPVMITGDSEATAQAVAGDIGIEDVMARVLPDEKADRVRSLQEEGHRVVMVGDGINDAPALMQSDVGMAIGAGTDIAIDSSDVVIMGNRVGAVVDALSIGENSYRKTKQNLWLAFSFNGIGVPAASTGWVHPIFAMAAMIGSVTAVLANSFGGRLIMTEPSADHAGTRRLTLDVPDIHCEGCAETVHDTLTGRFDRIEVDVDVEDKRVRVTSTDGPLDEQAIEGLLTEEGYPPEVAEKDTVS